jgi:hypothetical protein
MNGIYKCWFVQKRIGNQQIEVFMVRNTLVILILLVLIFSTISHAQIQAAPLFSVIVKEIARAAVVAVASEVGKSAIDHFKTLFNKNKKIADNFGKPQLKRGKISNKKRVWSLSPTGSLKKEEINELAEVLRSIDNNTVQEISVRIGNNNRIISSTQGGKVVIGNDTTSINISGNRDGTNIGSIGQSGGTTIVNNISGLSPAQMDFISEQLKLLGENTSRGQTSIEGARKNIENIDNELSKIQREKFDSLPEDAKKWVREMRELLETFRKQESLTQASLQKQIEYREDLSQQTVARLRELFREILSIVDSRALVLEKEKDWGISYTRTSDFHLFVEGRSAAKPIELGNIRFKNGSSVYIILLPGTLVQGIAEYSPELQFFQVSNGIKSHAFSFKERPWAATATLVPPPLVPPIVPKRNFNDVRFDPQQKTLGDNLKREFLSTFTQLIGSVMSNDAVAKPGELEGLRGLRGR